MPPKFDKPEQPLAKQNVSKSSEVPQGLSSSWSSSSSSSTHNESLSNFSFPFSNRSRSSSLSSSVSESKRRLSSANLLMALGEEDVIYLAIEPEVELIEEVGKGSSATVYKGFYQNKIVAVKVYKKPLNDEKDFIDEVMHTKLKHPHIAGLIAAVAQPAVGNEPAYYYLIIQYAAGGSLAELFKTNPDPESVSWHWRIKIALHISQALHFLHQKKITHGDLKSENVVFKDKEHQHAMLCDIAFGMGTDDYMAPELLINMCSESEDENDICFTHSSDVYALGILLNEILNHKKPFDKHVPSISFYKEIIQDNVRPKIRSRYEGESSQYLEYVNLITSCWGKTIDKRPSSQKVIENLTKISSGCNY